MQIWQTEEKTGWLFCFWPAYVCAQSGNNTWQPIRSPCPACPGSGSSQNNSGVAPPAATRWKLPLSQSVCMHMCGCVYVCLHLDSCLWPHPSTSQLPKSLSHYTVGPFCSILPQLCMWPHLPFSHPKQQLQHLLVIVCGVDAFPASFSSCLPILL